MQTTTRVKDPRKQRKRLFNAPAHIRHKLMAAPLAPELVKSRGIKSLPVRKGDTVRVMRGDRKGFEGKVSRVDLKNYRLYIEGLTREKVDGTTIFISLHPSKVMIKNLNLGDKWRKEVVRRKKQAVTKEKPAAKKKPAAAAKPKEQKPAEAKEKEEAEKKIEKPAKKPTAVKKVAEKKAASVKPKKAPAAKKEKKVVKEEVKLEETKAPTNKTRAKHKSSEEGGK